MPCGSEQGNNGNVAYIADYVYANGQKIARLTNSIYGGITTANYYLDDHLGTTQVELDALGNVTWQGQFTPFGAELPDGSTAMHYKFTGKERDTESGLDYFGARYYGSAMGRWMSPDNGSDINPADPQRWNLYVYSHNSPLALVDPDGHVATPAQSVHVASAIAQDRTLNNVFNASNNFSPRAFEIALAGGRLDNLNSGAGNILRGLAGEAEVLDRLNGTGFINSLFTDGDKAMPGSAGPGLPGVVPDIYVIQQNVGLLSRDPETPNFLMNVANANGGTGNVPMSPNITSRFMEVKSGLSASSISTGVDQAVATASAIANSPLARSAVSILNVDAGAWSSLSATARSTYVQRAQAGGAYIQVSPGLADAARQRAQNMIDRAR